MSKKIKPDYAYLNRKFMEGTDARPLRILSEYLLPDQQFKKEGIENMLVFFGSARAPSPEDAKKLKQKNPKDPKLKLVKYYEAAENLAFKLAKWNQDTFGYNKYCVCSGAGPGIMMAANRGAHNAGAKTIGLSIELPFENVHNPYVSKELSFNFHYFFMRKFWFAYRSEALIVMPGGFGTMDELFEMLTLIQTHKITKKFPIVLFGKKFWTDFINTSVLKKYGVISSQDLDCLFYTDSVNEAFTYITNAILTKNA
ncbi:MAG: LOG family protein [Gammaproteobacteria bacterium]